MLKMKVLMILSLLLCGMGWEMPRRSDSLGYYTPCWGDNNKIYFIKRVTYGRYYPKAFISHYIAIKSKYYLCSMNYDGTDKKEIVEIFGQKVRKMYERKYKRDFEYYMGPTEPYMDYCPATQKLVYNLKDTGIWVINIDGSDERCISSDGSHGSWSPDGKRIAYVKAEAVDDVDGGIIWVMDADGNNKEQISKKEKKKWKTRDGEFKEKEGFMDDFPLWSPKGDLIAFVCNDNIWVMKPDGSERRRVCGGIRFDGWTPDGEKIVFEGDKLLEGRYVCNSYLIGLDGKTREEVKGVGVYSLDGKFRIHRLSFDVWDTEREIEIDPFANVKRTKYKGHFVYKRPNNIW